MAELGELGPPFPLLAHLFLIGANELYPPPLLTRNGSFAVPDTVGGRLVGPAYSLLFLEGLPIPLHKGRGDRGDIYCLDCATLLLGILAIDNITVVVETPLIHDAWRPPWIFSQGSILSGRICLKA